MLERIALYSALALTLYVLGVQTGSTNWWCIIALFIANEWVAKREGYDDAIELSQAVLHRANDMLKEAKALRAMKGYTDEQ